MAMWVLGFLLFIASPKDMYLIWFLVVHIAKGAIGLILLNNMPKTYEKATEFIIINFATGITNRNHGDYRSRRANRNRK